MRRILWNLGIGNVLYLCTSRISQNGEPELGSLSCSLASRTYSLKLPSSRDCEHPQVRVLKMRCLNSQPDLGLPYYCLLALAECIKMILERNTKFSFVLSGSVEYTTIVYDTYGKTNTVGHNIMVPYTQPVNNACLLYS